MIIVIKWKILKKLFINIRNTFLINKIDKTFLLKMQINYIYLNFKFNNFSNNLIKESKNK